MEEIENQLSTENDEETKTIATDEARILASYKIIKKGEEDNPTSAQSNVLFLERYKELIKDDGGELMTIIDDTVLNGEKSQAYRDWLLENFVIVQVVSLPFNTFYRADANVKTTMIHLRRKRVGERQSAIFMAITNNIGIDDHQRDTPERNNLPTVLKYYLDWVSYGKLDPVIVYNNDEREESLSCPLQIFVVEPEKLNKKRLDAFYYSVELTDLRKHLENLEGKNKIKIKHGRDFELISQVKEADEVALRGKVKKYFEIGDVTRSGVINTSIEKFYEELPTRGRLLVKKNDIIFAKNINSRGTTLIIPEWYSDNLVTTGFIGIRPKDEKEALILWSVLESEVIRKQIYYLAITASQPEVRETIFKNEFLIPWPVSESNQDRIIKAIMKVEEAKERLSESIDRVMGNFNDLIELDKKGHSSTGSG